MVSGLDEDELVLRIAGRVASGPSTTVGIGDDAAVAGDTVICHDMLVEDVHFRWSWASPGDLGHKALAVNLSDLAAMGVSPVLVVVGLALGPGPLRSTAGVDALYDAMAELAAYTGCAIVGGDTSTAATTVVGVTVVGRLEAGVPPVLRSTGLPGDVVYVTGRVGAAAAGLAINEGRAPASLDPAGTLVHAQLRPTPRVEWGRALARAGATAMIDCSDGLARDLGRLAKASGVEALLELRRIPVAVGVDRVAGALGEDPALFAATGGEDYELIVTFPPDTPLPDDVPLTAVGTLGEGSGLRTEPPGLLDHRQWGWQHRV